IPELFHPNQGFWFMVSDARTDFAMTMTLLFLISVGAAHGLLTRGSGKKARSVKAELPVQRVIGLGEELALMRVHCGEVAPKLTHASRPEATRRVSSARKGATMRPADYNDRPGEKDSMQRESNPKQRSAPVQSHER